MLGKLLLQAAMRWHLALMLAVMLMLCGMTPAMAAHTSVECPLQSGTVVRGGIVSINVTDCTTIIGFAGIGSVDGPALPANGSASLRITGSQWFVDYAHNSNSATSDVFEFTDGTIAGNAVRV
jgi:large repetitive protein